MEDVAGRLDRRSLEGVAEQALAVWGTVRFRYRLAASLTGYAITGFVAWFILTNHPGWVGRDVDVWIRVGSDVRSGVSPYGGGPWQAAFFYAPPWALLLGAISWLGKPLVWAIIASCEVLSLRYIAGSWLRVGYFGLCFLTGAEIVSGAFNLVIAAGLAATIRGDSRLAALTALAKLSPVLAIRELRGPVIVLGAAVILTVPVFGWWGDWVAQLANASSSYTTNGYHEIPWSARLLFGLAVLIAWRSPRAGALAAAAAIPGLYAISVVLLYALVAQPAAEPVAEMAHGTSGTVDATRRSPMLTGRWWVNAASTRLPFG